MGWHPNLINSAKMDTDSFEDDLKSRHSTTTITKENMDLIHQRMMDDIRLTLNHIVNDIGKSREGIKNNLLNEFGMTKLSAWKVPRLVIRCLLDSQTESVWRFKRHRVL